MSKIISECGHSDTYNDSCNSCLYNELFVNDIHDSETDSLEDLYILLEATED